MLFVVSAGNHAGPIDLDLPRTAWPSADAQAREAAILSALKANARNRRILSPAESVNALTVGAAHSDACSQGPHAAYHCDPFPTRSLASPISANGLGFLRALKPEILMPGGRQIYQDAVGTGEPTSGLLPLPATGSQARGRRSQAKCQASGTRPSGSVGPVCRRARTRLGARLFEMLESLRATATDRAPAPRYDAVLLKALLVHGARWAEAGDRMRGLFKPEVSGHNIKEFIG